MINLAGRPDAEKHIVDELQKAGITIISDADCFKNEVSVKIAGELGQFKFVRGWYYWIVSGKVPLVVAEELYKNSVGKKDVRVAGHCGCPPPRGWVTWFDEKGVPLIGIKQKKSLDALCKKYNWQMTDVYHTVPKADFPKFGKPFITIYHIDSQEGLNLFVTTLKLHNLV